MVWEIRLFWGGDCCGVWLALGLNWFRLALGGVNLEAVTPRNSLPKNIPGVSFFKNILGVHF